LDLMIRTVRERIRLYAFRVLGAVVAVIPAAGAEIRAADKSQTSVDHNELLVMAGPERVATVKTELQPLVRRRIKDPLLPPLPL
jgi:hypothetical protein